jgi:hypothetical protein
MSWLEPLFRNLFGATEEELRILSISPGRDSRRAPTKYKSWDLHHGPTFSLTTNKQLYQLIHFFCNKIISYGTIKRNTTSGYNPEPVKSKSRDLDQFNNMTRMTTARQRLGKHIPEVTPSTIKGHPLLCNEPINKHSWEQKRWIYTGSQQKRCFLWGSHISNAGQRICFLWLRLGTM